MSSSLYENWPGNRELNIRWPEGKRIAVMLGFDLDAETMWTTRGDGNADHITNLSRGAYGPVQGVPRLLAMLDDFGLKATFLCPAWWRTSTPRR